MTGAGADNFLKIFSPAGGKIFVFFTILSEKKQASCINCSTVVGSVFVIVVCPPENHRQLFVF